MKNLPLLAFLLLIISCKKESNNLPEIKQSITIISAKSVHSNTSGYYDSIRQQAINNFMKKKSDYTILDKAIGVITNTGNLNFGDTIPLLDKNKKISSLYIYNDEYQVVAFKCFLKDSLFYKVIQESNSNPVYIQKSDKIRFEPWEAHVLSAPFIGFSPKTNSIHKDPKTDSPILPYIPDEFYSPVQLKGNWMQIIWGDNGNYQYGWIKWKENNSLIIELFYFA